jgi:sulfate permease, SulP family
MDAGYGRRVSSGSRARTWLRSIAPRREHVRDDTTAGITGAIAGVPDGMAASILAGVSPIQGLYASFAGPIGGGLTTSTRLMVITTTSAAALAAGSALEGVGSDDRAEALFLLTVLAGVAMFAAGLARLGRYTRFVSHSVMKGFLTGVAVNIVLGQIPDLTGADAKGSIALARAVDVLTHPASIDPASLATGLAAAALMVLLARTRLATVSALLALAIPTVAVIVAGASSVLRVNDVGAIPSGIPLPHLPELGMLSFSLLTGALAVAAIVLVQGAGVSEAAPNPGGRPSDTDRDFLAQGVGNIAAGLFRGQPVGGSVGRTALNVAAGARTRWGAIFSGIWMLLILALFSGVVGAVALPTLAALLIVAAIGSLDLGELATIYRTGPTSQIAIVTTFLATLFLPIASAVGIGVALSLLLQLNREALDLSVVELVRRPDDRFAERPPPEALPSDRVTMLDVYGSLFYAGARTLQDRLPDPAGSRSPAVVLRLRGRTTLGATFFAVVTDYATRLSAVGGRLFLSGVDPVVARQLRESGWMGDEELIETIEATEIVGESSLLAYDRAEAWLAEQEGSR